MKTATAQPEQLRKAERVLRLIWVIASGAILFSMLTVTPLVQRVTDAEWDWTAPILPLVVDAAVIIVVRMDSEVSRLGAKAGGWATVLRWMTGLFTLGLNIGDSALKADAVGVGIHAVAPMLLIATSEAIPRYRRTIALGLERIAREKAAEQTRREQAQAAERERERQSREQAEERRERLEREQRERADAVERERLEAAERAGREQRDHEARLAREQREFQARLEQERQDREDERRRQEQARQDELARLEREAEERRERERRAERERSGQARREQQPAPVREHPQPTRPPVREHRPLHAVNTPQSAPVNTPKGKPANTDKMPESAALEMIRTAVNNGQPGVRALARETRWSPAWVSARVAELRGDDAPATAEEQEVSA